MVGLDLALAGAILSGFGVIASMLGLAKKSETVAIHEGVEIEVDPSVDASGASMKSAITRPPWQYLNVMTPIKVDSNLELKIEMISGICKFRIVEYWGFPAPLESGRWKSNIYFPTKGEYADVNEKAKLTESITLLKGPYVSEFHVRDSASLTKFQAKFTAKATYDVPRFKHAETILEFGRIFVTIGVSVLVTGLVLLFPP
jgi:hypothetical protein